MRTVLFTAVLALATLSGCAKSEKADPAAAEAAAKLPAMTVDEVDQAIASKQATAVDCNGDGTRKKMGVVPGAILVSEDDTYTAAELPADKTTKLVFYCANSG
jgi:hypothetical protein